MPTLKQRLLLLSLVVLVCSCVSTQQARLANGDGMDAQAITPASFNPGKKAAHPVTEPEEAFDHRAAFRGAHGLR